MKTVNVVYAKISRGGTTLRLDSYVDNLWYFVPGGVSKRYKARFRTSLFFPGIYQIDLIKEQMDAAPPIADPVYVNWEEAYIMRCANYAMHSVYLETKKRITTGSRLSSGPLSLNVRLSPCSEKQ